MWVCGGAKGDEEVAGLGFICDEGSARVGMATWTIVRVRRCDEGSWWARWRLCLIGGSWCGEQAVWIGRGTDQRRGGVSSG